MLPLSYHASLPLSYHASLKSFAIPLVIKHSTKHHTNEVKRVAIELRRTGVSPSTFHVKEAGGDHFEDWKDH
jgi:hypothetical protein